MIKKVFNKIDLTCMMQNEDSQNTICKGVMSIDATNGKFRFEEAAPAAKEVRNIKLFAGDYISIVHKQNGKYQCHMRTLTASPDMDRKEIANKIYSELLQALEVMN